VTLVLAGELDLASTDKVDRALRKTLAGDTQQLLIDLRDVEFIDSSGLRLLLSVRSDAKRGGYQLMLRAPRSEARRIFVVTGTRGLFDWGSH
jgi:anti-anti-sigma factor